MATHLGLGLGLTYGGQAMSSAMALLARLGDTYGLSIDFASDKSIAIRDSGTPANNYASSGTVASGALVGPGGKLTYASPSPKLTMQSTGYLAYGAHNLYLNSAVPANQSITVNSGTQYSITITGSVSITWSGAYVGTTTVGTTTFTAASGTLTGGSTSGSGTVQVSKYPAVTDYIATGASALYALPYEYSGSTCLGVLVEEARTNLLTYSNTFSNAAWAAFGTGASKVGAAGVTDPAGGSDAYEFNLGTDGGASASCIYHSVAVTATTAYTGSIYIRAKTGTTTVRLSINDAAADTFTADLSLTTTWQRIPLTRTAAGTGTGNFAIRNNVAGNSANVYVYIGQFEAGSTASSVILTGSASVTRAADNISLLTSAFPYAWPLTMYVQATSLDTNGSPGTLAINGGGGPSIEMYRSGASASYFTSTGGAGAVGTITANTTFKQAAALNTNDCIAAFNGTTGGADAVVSAPGSLPVASLRLGWENGGSATINGYIKQAMFLPRRASNGELVTLTS